MHFLIKRSNCLHFERLRNICIQVTITVSNMIEIEYSNVNIPTGNINAYNVSVNDDCKM